MLFSIRRLRPSLTSALHSILHNVTQDFTELSEYIHFVVQRREFLPEEWVIFNADATEKTEEVAQSLRILLYRHATNLKHRPTSVRRDIVSTRQKRLRAAWRS